MTNQEILSTLQYLVGTRYVRTVKAYISEITGRPLVVGPNEIVTKDFNPERVHIQADNAGVITGFGFN